MYLWFFLDLVDMVVPGGYGSLRNFPPGEYGSVSGGYGKKCGKFGSIPSLTYASICIILE